MGERLKPEGEFNARVDAFVRAQQTMEDEGCPNVLPPEKTREIAEGLAAVGIPAGFRPDRGSKRLGKGVLGGPISTANSLDSERAERTGPRIPGA